MPTMTLILTLALIGGPQPAVDCLAAAHEQYREATKAWKATDYERARRLYRESIQAFTELESWTDLVSAHHAYLFVALPSEEDEYFTRGIELARRFGNEGLEGQLLHVRADHLFGAGDFARAEEMLQRAIALLEGSDERYLGSALVSLGRINRAHGRPKEALEHYNRALVIQEALGARESAIQTINAIGVAYSHLGEPEKALEQFQTALQKAIEINAPHLIGFLRGAVANAHRQLGHYDEAIALLEQVVAEPMSDYLAAFRYGSLAGARFGAGQYEKAVEAANKAIELASANSVEPHLDALHVRAKALAKLGRMDEAKTDTERSLALIEELRAKLVPEDFMKRGFSDTYQETFGVALELHTDAGEHARALAAAELARGRSFLDLLATRRIAPAQMATRGDASESSLPSVVAADALPASEIAATARDLGSTLLVYWVSDDKTFIWVVAPDGTIRGRTAPVPAKRLAQLVGESWGRTAPGSTRGLVLRSGERMSIEAIDKSAWSELYGHLIRPVRDLLPSRRGSLLTVIPHGPLFRLSFAGLMNEKNEYLVESYAIHYTPAASVLRFIASRESEHDADGYLLLSNPRFGATANAKALPRLPGSDREVRSIARLLRDDSLTLMSDAGASEKEVRESIANKRVLHFATHGIVRDDQTLDSYLALAAGDGDKSNDGRLTAQEIYELDLDADLVVLSACRSGLGKISGDGVAGLTRAFFYAGASSVVATLWDVADEPTSSLLRDFYRSFRDGAATSRALRTAQLAMLRRLRAGEVTVETLAGPARLPEHPVFWASFVLQGRP